MNKEAFKSASVGALTFLWKGVNRVMGLPGKASFIVHVILLVWILANPSGFWHDLVPVSLIGLLSFIRAARGGGI